MRVVVGDCRLTEHQWLGLPYRNGTTIHVHAKHNTHEGHVPMVLKACGLTKQVSWPDNTNIDLFHDISCFDDVFNAIYLSD